MANFIVVAVVAAIVVAAVVYIVKEKKKGTRCIGCPAAGTCGKKAGCSCQTVTDGRTGEKK